MKKNSKEKGENKVFMEMEINSHLVTYYNSYFYGSYEYYKVNKTYFF